MHCNEERYGDKQAAGTQSSINPHLIKLSEQFLPYGSLWIRPIWPKRVDLFRYLEWEDYLTKIVDLFPVPM